MKRRSHDEAESMRVRVPHDQLSDLPLALQTAVVSQPARTVTVKSFTRIVDGTKPASAEEINWDKRFAAFHETNPHVYFEIERRALAMFAANPAKPIRVKRIMEDMRDDSAATKGDEFKLNNSYSSRFARLLVQEQPQLEHLVELRALTSKHEAAA